ncbi:MAG: trigger factor [Parcubacteria group bacterium]|nr:trigger factor [Parcubacteria group bacterium]
MSLTSEVRILPKSRVELSIAIPQERMHAYRIRAAERFSKEHPVPGFRPGKVPLSLLLERIDKETLERIALDIAIPETYQEVVTTTSLKPLGVPAIEFDSESSSREGELAPSVVEGPIRYRAVVAVMPEVQLGAYRDLKLTRTVVPVKDADIERALSELRELHAELRRVTRPAKNRDILSVDLRMSHNGVLLENGSLTNHPLRLGDETLIPGLSEALMDLTAGETKTFTLILPKNYRPQRLANETVTFTVTVREIREMLLPETDLTFAKRLGLPSIDELRTRITRELTRQREADADHTFERRLLAKLRENTSLEIPDELITEELRRMKDELTTSLGSRGSSLSEYLDALDKTEKALLIELTPAAQERVAIALILKAIADREKITPSKEEEKTMVHAGHGRAHLKIEKVLQWLKEVNTSS